MLTPSATAEQYANHCYERADGLAVDSIENRIDEDMKDARNLCNSSPDADVLRHLYQRYRVERDEDEVDDA